MTIVFVNLAMAAGGSSFISKPARGWLHPDHLVSNEGINYTVKVRYLLFYLRYINRERERLTFKIL